MKGNDKIGNYQEKMVEKLHEKQNFIGNAKFWSQKPWAGPGVQLREFPMRAHKALWRLHWTRNKARFAYFWIFIRIFWILHSMKTPILNALQIEQLYHDSVICQWKCYSIIFCVNDVYWIRLFLFWTTIELITTVTKPMKHWCIVTVSWSSCYCTM